MKSLLHLGELSIPTLVWPRRPRPARRDTNLARRTTSRYTQRPRPANPEGTAAPPWPTARKCQVVMHTTLPSRRVPHETSRPPRLCVGFVAMRSPRRGRECPAAAASGLERRRHERRRGRCAHRGGRVTAREPGVAEHEHLAHVPHSVAIPVWEENPFLISAYEPSFLCKRGTGQLL